MSERWRAGLAIVVTGWMLAACASAPAAIADGSPTFSAAPTAIPTPRPTQTPPTPAPPTSEASLTVSPSPSPAPSSVTDVASRIEVGDVLEVTGDGLAVRAGPGAHHPLVAEYLLGREDPIETTLLRDTVRLPAGHFVQAVVGPVVVDETTWYAVANVPQNDRETWEDTPIWRSVAPVPYSEIDFQLTWIAIGQPGAAFARVVDRPACPACYGDLPPGPAAAASGTGDGRVGPWTNTGVAYITLAGAAPSASSTCELGVTNQDGQSMFQEQSAVDYVEAFLPGVPVGAGTDAWLEVTGDCAWAIKVYAAEG